MDLLALPGITDYHEAWDLQRAVHDDVVAGTRPDTLILVEHPDVYTAGRRTNRSDRPDDGTPVVDVDRGGKITWHGPGQQVVYPIVRLAEPVDVVAYVRALEDAVMAVCTRLGLATMRVEGRSGLGRGRRDPSRAQGLRDRRARRARRDDARAGAQLRPGPVAVRADHPVRHRGRRRDVLTAELGREVTLAEVAPLLVDALGTALVRCSPQTPRTPLRPRSRDRLGLQESSRAGVRVGRRAAGRPRGPGPHDHHPARAASRPAPRTSPPDGVPVRTGYARLPSSRAVRSSLSRSSRACRSPC